MKLTHYEMVFAKILIKNSLATFDQVRECIELFQKQKKGSKPKSLAKIFYWKGYLDKKKLKKAESATRRALRLMEDIAYAKLAVKQGYVSEQQVSQCFNIQKAGNYKISLGEIFLLKDFLKEEQHLSLLQQVREQNHQESFTLKDLFWEASENSSKGNTEQKKKPFAKIQFGETAMRRLLVTSEQVEECLQLQEKMRQKGIYKKLGEVMLERNYITEVHVQQIISAIHVGKSEDRLIESYVIEEKLGEGAMGVVYKARMEGKNSPPIALKVLRPYIAETQDSLKRFIQEAKKAIDLDHPNIVRAFEVGVSGDYYYYTMEYVEGKTVKALLEEQEKLEIERVISISLDVAKALEYAASKNLIHRDVKPDNIIVETSGRAKLCDLGIAKDLHQDMSLTQTGIVVGTPYYLSPEIAKGAEDIDHRTDLYSLGATMYRMVTGRVPFEGKTATSVMVKHLTTPPTPPKKYRPELSDGLNRIILKLLEKDRKKRFQTATELIEEMEMLQ
ncbi:MAG: serine/threonine protein kinase [Planctomycetota bacterium]|nr:MAG: serine/threonine protein kinase [Planctomycetota bacterium]